MISGALSRITESGALRRALVVAGVVYVVAQVVVLMPREILSDDPGRVDIWAYYLAVERVHTGAPLYDPPLPPGPTRPGPYYVYPPVLAAALALLPRVGYATFASLWTTVLLVGFWVYALSLAALGSGGLSWRSVVVAGYLLGICPGAALAIGYGNADPLVWALSGLALALPGSGAAGWMAMAMIKPFGVWPLLFAVSRGGRKAAVEAGAIALAGLAVGVLSLGWGGFTEASATWLREVLPVLGQGTIDITNLSVTAGLLTLTERTGLWTHGGGPLPAWAGFTLTAVGVLVPLLVGWHFRGHDRRKQHSAILCAGVFASPYVLPGYLPLLLAPAAVWLHGSRRHRGEDAP